MFLSAAFLLGLVTLTAPWWLHRLRVHTSDRQVVSSLYLMRASEAPVRMEKRLQHRLLLALRMSLLAVAILAFARPFVSFDGQPGDVAPKTALLLVIDTSLSMDRDKVFSDAISEATRILEDHGPGTPVAIITAGEKIVVDLPMTSDPGAINDALARLKPDESRLRFAGLTSRIDQLIPGMAAPAPVTVHIISDFQANALPDTFNALLAETRWPMALHRVGNVEANWAIDHVQLVRADAPLVAGPPSERPVTDQLVVSLKGYHSPEALVSVTVEADPGEVLASQVLVGENGMGRASFDVTTGREKWTVRLTGFDATDSDSIAADNVYYLAIPSLETVSLPILASPAVTNERRDTPDVDPVRYFTTAVTSSSQRFTPVRVRGERSMGNMTPVLVMIDPGELTPAMGDETDRFLRTGGAVFMTVGPATIKSGQLPLIGSGLSMNRFDQTVRRVVVADPTHPVLQQTRWDAVSVLRRATLDRLQGSRAILSTGDGEPLLLEYSIGAGRVLVLLTALSPDWSTMVIEPTFVQFVQQLLGYLAKDTLPAAAVVGEPIIFGTPSVQLFDPDGGRVLGLSDTVDRPTVRVSKAGQYQVRTPGGSRPLAVNIPAAESDLEPAPDSTLSRWQQSIGAAGPAMTQPDIEGKPLDTVAELAPWLLALLLVLALLEPLFANGLPNVGTNRLVRQNASNH